MNPLVLQPLQCCCTFGCGQRSVLKSDRQSDNWKAHIWAGDGCGADDIGGALATWPAADLARPAPDREDSIEWGGKGGGDLFKTVAACIADEPYHLKTSFCLRRKAVNAVDSGKASSVTRGDKQSYRYDSWNLSGRAREVWEPRRRCK